MPPSPPEPTPGAEGQGGLLSQVLGLTEQAETLLLAGRIEEAFRKASEAALFELNLERTWRVLAHACEATGDFGGALAAYSRTVAVAPALGEIGPGMGHAALRVGEYATAERVLALYLQEAPATTGVIVDLARAQAARQAYDRALATLKAALGADPGQPALWSALGEILCMEGRHAEAIVFFEEALRLHPDLAAAHAGLADALLLGAGEIERTVALSEQAVAKASPAELSSLTADHGRRLLSAGRLADGWTAFARSMEPGPAAVVENRVAAPPWSPGAALGGRLLVMGEASVTEELLLAQVIPSLLAENVPLIIAVSPRWTNLAQRSFPQAKVVPLLTRSERGAPQHAADLDTPHVHAGDFVGAWTPLRSLMPAYRGNLADFTGAGPFLKPDNRRVRYWRELLAALGPGPKIGLRWRQPLVDVTRPSELPSMFDLQGPLSAPGLHLISLQDGEVLGETDGIREAFGLKVHEPPGLRREDLDDFAALARALDVVVGPPGAVTYLAAACGAKTWFLSPPRHWAMLGTGGYPWFPKAKVISAASTDWSGTMDELSQALEALARRSADPTAG